MKIGLLFRNYGPYHLARALALRQRADLMAIEVAAVDSEYCWDIGDSKADAGVFAVSQTYPRSLLERYRARRCLSRVIGQAGLDVLAIAGWSEPICLAALECAQKVNLPTVVMSDSRIEDEPRSLWRERLKGRIVPLFGGALVAGRSHASYVEKLGMPASRIRLGFDVVDNEFFSREAKRARDCGRGGIKHHSSLPDRYFFVCCRLIPEKNLSTVIQAFCMASKSEASMPHLVVAGDGPLRAALLRQARSAGVGSRVHFLGAVSYSDLPALYAYSDALILASWKDTWGLVVNEALAAGVPVIVSTGVGCAHELVEDGENGLLFDPHIPAQLAEAMVKMASEIRRDEMGACGQRTIANWSVDRFAEALIEAASVAREGPIKRMGLSDRLLLNALSRR